MVSPGQLVRIGTLVDYEPGDICDLRVRTIDGEPYWIFASSAEPHPERSKFARLRELIDEEEPGSHA